MVRCIYRQAGTPLADDQDQALVPDKEGVQELVDRYTLALCHVPPSLLRVGDNRALSLQTAWQKHTLCVRFQTLVLITRLTAHVMK